MGPLTKISSIDDSASGPKVNVSSQPQLLIKKLSEKATTPTRGSAFAAGYDLYSAHDTIVPARGKTLVHTDLAIAVPVGTCKDASRGNLSRPSTDANADGRIAPRSGLASKNFIDTGAGVIDADYRGHVKVLLFNHAEMEHKIQRGDRVAQLILERVCTTVNPVKNLRRMKPYFSDLGLL